MPWGGKRAGAGTKPLPRLTPEEFEAIVQGQGGLCALRAGQRRRLGGRHRRFDEERPRHATSEV